MIYLSVFVVSIFVATISCRSKNKTVHYLGLLCSMLPLCILAWLRDETIGVDVLAYPLQSLFHTKGMHVSEIFLFDGLLESGYLFLAWLVNLYDGQLSTLLLLTQIIITLCFYIGFYRIRQYVPIWLSIMLYCFLFYNMGLNMMRQSLGMSVVFLGFTFLLPDLGLFSNQKPKKQDIIKYLSFVFIALCFHKSAVVSVILLPIFYYRNIKINLICIIGVVVTFFMYTSLLNHISSLQGFEKLESYSEGGDYKAAFSISEFFLRICFLYVLFVSRTKFGSAYLSIMTVFVIEFVLNLFQLKSAFFGRIGYYNYILYIPYISYSILNKKGKIEKSLLAFSVLSLVVFYWWFVFIYGCAGATYPYTSKILDI